MNLGRLQWRSLKTRVTFTALFVLMAGICLLTFYVSRMLREDMQQQLSQQQLSAVSFIANHVNHELDERMQVLHVVAASVQPAQLADDHAMQALLDKQALLLAMFNGGVLAYRTDGVAIAETPRSVGRVGTNHLYIDTIAAALLEGRATFSRPIMGKALRAPVFGMSVPIRDGQGRVVGALSGVTNLGKPNFLDQITGSTYGKSGHYAIVDRRNRLVVTSSDKLRIMQPLPAPGTHALTDRLLRQNAGSAIGTSQQGGEELLSSQDIPLAGWVLTASLPTEEAFAPIQSMQQRMLLAACLLSLLAGVLIWWLLRRQLSPLQQAASMLTQLAEQPPAVSALPIQRHDEIGSLIAGFNRLLAKLAQRERALQESRSMLSEILANVDASIYLKDTEGRYLFANRPVLTFFGASLEEVVGQRDEHFFDPDTAARLCLNDRQVLDQGLVLRTEESNLQVQGRCATYWTVKLPLRNAAGEIYALCGISTDMTESKRIEKYEQFRSQTLELLVKGASLPVLLQAIVQGVEQVDPAMLCSILLLDEDGRHLGQSVAPSLPEFYVAAIDGVEIGVGVGSCGTAAITGQRVIVEDIQQHAYWAPYKELAARAGLAACWSQPILSSAGKVLGTFAIYAREVRQPGTSDIAIIEQSAHLVSIALERKQAEDKLHLAASVFTHAREGIMITSLDGRIIDINAAFSQMSGYSRAEVLGQNTRLFKSGRHPDAFYSELWQQLGICGYWSGELWNRHKNAEICAEMVTISAIRDSAGSTRQYVALFSDISALKAHQNQLEYMAHYDALTRLPNRILLADRLQQAMRQSSRSGHALAVVYLDLDGFKEVNDQYGHAAGDQLLLVLADGMRNALRDGDTLARLGGDEFVAVLPDLSEPAACKPILARLLDAAAQTAMVNGEALQVSASVGVTFYPQQQEAVDADQLLRQADQAMYQAKLAGRNRFHLFDAEEDRNIRHHHASLKRLRQALNDGEFVLYYQPKVNMRSGEVVGAEALIRWQHPEQGLLPPGEFLSAIENDPLAIELGEWVIATALAQMLAWREAGLDIPVSVNIGAYQLQQAGFATRLRALLAAQPAVRPGDLELEVLETSAMEDLSGVSQLIAACGEIGVVFALDDFGTGYSSLTYLKRLPVVLLKVDQSFVRDMLEDADDLAILEGVISLAATFRRQLIAEGVETIAHGELLLQLGCELAQGYGIARPMPGPALPDWAALWRPDPAWQDVAVIERHHLPLLFAQVEHQAWMDHMVRYLRGGQVAQPALDPKRCRLGLWLGGEGLLRYGALPALTQAAALHDQVHAQAARLCEWRVLGRQAQADAGIEALQELHAGLQDQLKKLEVVSGQGLVSRVEARV
ncbi:bifunctional diguanylate cyclase/phosphodiesterase [Craterilacuibacter sinensis]|uniref:EAL domain-containing protein n=1 Tax=Craterilacuibacter sinensis TaxID=2686017 RepID=A0A845BUF5_9NEIS|nr:EAL domain-containing protein [Craterilacuibacter sinensis]MXR36163.1 EAL domain-containing protein [Craterilacuibacter sinensis]